MKHILSNMVIICDSPYENADYDNYFTKYSFHYPIFKHAIQP